MSATPLAPPFETNPTHVGRIIPRTHQCPRAIFARLLRKLFTLTRASCSLRRVPIILYAPPVKVQGGAICARARSLISVFVLTSWLSFAADFSGTEQSTRRAYVAADLMLSKVVFSSIGDRVLYSGYYIGASPYTVFMGDREFGPYDQIRGLRFSPSGGHFVFTGKRELKWQAIIDGIAGPTFDDVGAVTFSSDGVHYAYIARDKGKAFIVLDGVPGMMFDTVSGDRDPAEPFAELVNWGPDNMPRYVANRRCIVQGTRVDCLKQVKKDEYITGFRASPDDRQLAVEVKKQPYNVQVLLLDNPKHKSNGPVRKIGKEYASPITFLEFCCPGHVVFVGKRGADYRVVRDGQEGPAFAQIGQLLFSPKKDLHGYIAISYDPLWRFAVVMGGRQSPAYDVVLYPLFDPSGRTIAFFSGRQPSGPRGEAYFSLSFFDGRDVWSHGLPALAAPVVSGNFVAFEAWPPVFDESGERVAYLAVERTSPFGTSGVPRIFAQNVDDCRLLYRSGTCIPLTLPRFSGPSALSFGCRDGAELKWIEVNGFE